MGYRGRMEDEATAIWIEVAQSEAVGSRRLK